MATATATANDMLKSVLSYIAGALLMVVMAVVGFQQQQIGKLDDKIYTLQATTVTEDKLNTAINRLSVEIDTKISGIKNEQQITNKWLERVVLDRGASGRK
jgi:predicted PurR-regulated permease PerM